MVPNYDEGPLTTGRTSSTPTTTSIGRRVAGTDVQTTGRKGQETIIGEQVIDLSDALIRFVRLVTEDVRDMERPPIDDAPGGEVAALEFGTAHPCIHVLLGNWAAVEIHPTWSRAILATPLELSLPTDSDGGSRQPDSSWVSRTCERQMANRSYG